ncbi:unnamed protein product [Closterium sp. Naga37s-1]|nr:unnamed protein product [Closterium sp. Naga37s-1]
MTVWLCIAPLPPSFQTSPTPRVIRKADLAKVDRKVTPWLLVAFHEAWYHNNKDHHLSGEAMRVALEKTLYDARTDVVVCGHVHSYERTVGVRHLRRCLALEKLLYDARTDVVVCGHVHAYERTVSVRTLRCMHMGMRAHGHACGHAHGHGCRHAHGHECGHAHGRGGVLPRARL